MVNVAVPPNMEKMLKGKDDLKIDVRIGDFLTDDFFRTFTKFESYGEFVHFSPYSDDALLENTDLFDNDDMSRYISLTTDFENFEKLFAFAVQKQFESIGGKYE